MGKVRTPLLSFGASGKIANTLVFFNWKGLDVVREYVVPANPKSAAQVTQRGLFTDAVAAFRNYFTDADERSALNRSATAQSGAQSGFNVFMRNVLAIIGTTADASYANGAAAGGAGAVSFTMLNADDGATGDEAGNFECWSGTTPTNLLNEGNGTIIAGAIMTPALGVAGQVRYCKVRKDAADRSGIHKITLT